MTAGETASGYAMERHAAYRQGKGRGKTRTGVVNRRSSQHVHGGTDTLAVARAKLQQVGVNDC